MQKVYDPAREELFYVDGQAPDPEGEVSGGVGPTVNLARTAIAHPQVRHGDLLLETDLHLDDNHRLYLLVICPRCRNQIRIHSLNKQVHYDPNRLTAHGGAISVERFTCPWELTREQVYSGVHLCRWEVTIEDNIAIAH